MMNIRLLKNKDIDIPKWDRRVSSSQNARVYALSWFLDVACPGWYGLVCDDYRYVMPVCVASKYGFRYAYQPVYAQQHGIFPLAETKIADGFLSVLQQNFRFFEIQVNGCFPLKDNRLELEEKANYLLDLNRAYDDIYSTYSAHCRRNLKRATKVNVIKPEVEPELLFRLKKEHSSLPLDNKTFAMLEGIARAAVQRECGFVRAAYTNDGEPTGAALFIRFGQRVLYLNAVSSPEGKKNRSMYAILNSVIEEYSDSSLMLDFEGSIVPGIAKFFAGFGAKPECYQKIKYNNLPLLLKKLKK